MGPLVWINGKIVPESEAWIPVNDSAYLYGEGVFETLRASRRSVLFLQDHLSRLRRNAKILGLEMPLSPARLGREIARLLKKSRLSDAYLRITLSREHLVILARTYQPFPLSFYRSGASLVTVRSVRNDAGTIAAVKTTSYLTKILARREAVRKGAVDGILLNTHGRVTEGAGSNVFMVKRGKIVTPPLSEGLMPGIRRKVLLQLARRLRIPVLEKPMTPKELQKGDEIFITSTLKGIMPIRSFDGIKIGKQSPGPVTTRLMQAYERVLM